MEKLDKTYEAIEMLQNLGIPVSSEQYDTLRQLENEYLRDEVIPFIKGELEPMVEKMKSRFQLDITYSSEDGLDINLIERSPTQEQLFNTTPGKRQKKYIIRVIFPDGQVSCHKLVLETLLDVVRYAGTEKVKQMNINVLGDNFISTELSSNTRYRIGQKEVEPGLYVNTYTSTETKLEQIKTINRTLNLGLKIEKVML